MTGSLISVKTLIGLIIGLLLAHIFHQARG